FPVPNIQLVERRRVELQQRPHDLADDGPAHVQHALVGRRERPPGRVPHRQAKVLLVQRTEVFRKDRLLLELLRRRGGGVVGDGEIVQRGGGHAPFYGVTSGFAHGTS